MPNLLALASDVLTHEQAVDVVGADRLRALVAAQKWQRPAHDVYVAHNGPLTDPQRELVALLACPPGSALAGLTGLARDGLVGFVPPRPCVLLPMGARRPSYDDVTAHWSSVLAVDVHPLRVPRRTRTARSTVDAASWERNERFARAVVLAAVQQRIVRGPLLLDALSRRGRCRHRALIGESILDAEGGVQSLPERDFDTIRRGIGVPSPDRQAVLRRRDGRYYLDARWTQFNTAVEIHGLPHLRVLDWEADLERANEITIAGPSLLIFSSYAVRRQAARVADQLVRMLHRGGWRG